MPRVSGKGFGDFTLMAFLLHAEQMQVPITPVNTLGICYLPKVSHDGWNKVHNYPRWTTEPCKVKDIQSFFGVHQFLHCFHLQLSDPLVPSCANLQGCTFGI